MEICDGIRPLREFRRFGYNAAMNARYLRTLRRPLVCLSLTLSACMQSDAQEPLVQMDQTPAAVDTLGIANDSLQFEPVDLAAWVPLNVPPETFRLDGEIFRTTGEPTGLIRSPRMYENFVAEIDWRHLKVAGNSGLFVWADGFPAAGTVFPRGIEVQMLDPGYDRPGKNTNFSSHGDIFAVQGAKLLRAGRVSPSGRRSFPIAETTLPSPQWNHYRLEAVDGRLQLHVNGTLVSTADGASPRKGYLMLESEGSPAEFKNFRIAELPSSGAEGDDVAASAPVANNPTER